MVEISLLDFALWALEDGSSLWKNLFSSYTRLHNEASQKITNVGIIPVFDLVMNSHQHYTIDSYYNLEAQRAPSIHCICPKWLKIANSLTLAKKWVTTPKSANNSPPPNVFLSLDMLVVAHGRSLFRRRSVCPRHSLLPCEPLHASMILQDVKCPCVLGLHILHPCMPRTWV